MFKLKLRKQTEKIDKQPEPAHPETTNKKPWQQRRYQVAGGIVVLILILLVLLGTHSGKKANDQTAGNNSSRSQQSQEQANPGGEWVSPAIYAQLPNCSGSQLLSNMPVDLNTPYDMIPLGLVNGTGGHTYPSDHTYFNFDGRAGTYQVVSPGNVYVTKIRRISRVVSGTAGSDASVYMMPCKQVVFYFNHVQITDALDKAIPNTNDPKTNDCAFAGRQNSHQNSQTNTVNSDCSQLATTLVKLTPGEPIGTATASQNSAGFDFGAIDSRAPRLKLLNPNSEDTGVSNGLTYLKSVCPINYMPAAVQQIVFAKPGFAKRPAATKCGEIAQDKLGTIQGNWYQGGSLSGNPDWSKELAVVHYNIDPSIADISVGGMLGSGGEMGFTPNTSGTTNPEPSTTKVGPLYCFMATVPANQEPSDPSYTDGHKILLQLTSSKTMKAEYQSGQCTGSDQFTNPVTYYR